MFTHTHGPDGHEHVHCHTCGADRAFPWGDTRGIRAWKTQHQCRPPREARAA